MLTPRLLRRRPTTASSSQTPSVHSHNTLANAKLIRRALIIARYLANGTTNVDGNVAKGE